MKNIKQWLSHIFHGPEAGQFVDRSQYFLGLRIAALLEIAIFILFIVGLSYIFSDGTRYINIKPHPFWLVLLLITIQYGVNEAIICALIMTATLYAFNLPEHEVTKTSYEYWLEVFIRPIMWITVAMLIGGLRSRQVEERNVLKTDLKTAQTASDAIAESYEKLKNVKETLENKLAGEMTGAANAYKAAHALESLNPGRILIALEEVISNILEPRNFSVYAAGPKGLEIAISHDWPDDHKYALRFEPDSTLHKTITQDKRICCLINEGDDAILENQGLLAGPLIDSSTGEIFGMLKIESFGFMELSINTIEMFKMLCEWLGMSYGNALRYQQSREERIMDREHIMLSAALYDQEKLFITAMAQALNFDLSVVSIKTTRINSLEAAKRKQVLTSIKDAVAKNLRSCDLIFDLSHVKTQFPILLPGINTQGGKEVIATLQTALKDVEQDLSGKVTFSYEIEEIFTAGEGAKTPIETPTTPVTEVPVTEPTEEVAVQKPEAPEEEAPQDDETEEVAEKAPTEEIPTEIPTEEEPKRTTLADKEEIQRIIKQATKQVGKEITKEIIAHDTEIIEAATKIAEETVKEYLEKEQADKPKKSSVEDLNAEEIIKMIAEETAKEVSKELNKDIPKKAKKKASEKLGENIYKLPLDKDDKDDG